MNAPSQSTLDFQSIFEATPGPYLILAPDFTIIAVNDAYCRATMTVREEIVGRALFEVFPDNPDDLQATGESNLRSSLNRVLALRRPDAMAFQKYDIRRPASEGGGFEERHWSPLNAPVLDRNGALVAIVHHAQDVTDLVRLQSQSAARDALAREQHTVIDQLRAANRELALQIEANERLELERRRETEAHERAATALTQSEQKFRTLADNLPGVVYQRIMTPSGEIEDVYVSQGLKLMLGVEPEAIMSGGKTLFDFVHPEDRERKLSALKESAARGKTLVIEVRKLAQPDGNVRWWEIHTTPTRLADGNVQWDAIALDVTDHKAAQQQLHQAVKMDAVGQLTGGIAHDFNNLLTVILGNSELLVERGVSEERVRSLAALTLAAAERGAELTKRLLAFARRQALEPRTIDVNRVIADLDPLLRRTLGENIEIEVVRGAGLWHAFVDPTQLELALLNLAINSRDAMPDGGRLTIETANARIDDTYAAKHDEVLPGQYVVMAISDAGSGMTAATLARAFEPFFSTKEVGKGTGLGLSMVYGFVKQSGGHVKIYSEVGHGTTVKIYLPRSVEAAAGDVSDAARKLDVGGTESILLVEDDDIVRQHVEQMLIGLGYSVASANNGPSALALLQTERHFDLLFTDIVMPGGMSGRALADAALALHPRLKVLFTSGYTENAVVHHGRVDPGVHLIHKPYRRRDLAAKLRQVLEAG